MDEYYFEERKHSAIEELKRADHLLFVSLKYTRTCDVILNVISRLISADDLAMKELLDHCKNKKIIKTIPVPNKDKIKEVIRILGPKSKKYIKLYDTLKSISTCKEIEAREEFRKNITLTAKLKKPIEVKANTLVEYYTLTREFVVLIMEYISK